MYTESNRQDDFQWFLNNYMDLYKKYGRKFFAIQNKVILGIYNDKDSAVDVTAEKYPLGSFIVQECNGNETGYTNYITSWELV